MHRFLQSARMRFTVILKARTGMVPFKNRMGNFFLERRITLFLLASAITTYILLSVLFHRAPMDNYEDVESLETIFMINNNIPLSSIDKVASLQKNENHFERVGTYQRKKSDLKLRTNQTPIVEIIDGKSGFGIVYFLYGNETQLKTYLEEVLQSAETFWRAEPNLSIALITNDPTLVGGVTHHFTHIIKIPPEINYPGRQWLTRIESLRLTPFLTTLAVDSDTFACTNISDDFKLADMSFDYDYAFAGYHNCSNETIFVDAGVMLMRWTPGTKTLLKEWAKVHKQKMTQLFTNDDQISLALTLLMAKKLNFTVKTAKLHNSYGLRWYGAKGEGWENRQFEHTLVVQGEVRTIHMRTMYANYRIICDIINEKSVVSRPRLFTVNRKVHRGLWGKLSEAQLRNGFRLAFSAKECAYQLNGTVCREMDWSSRNILTPLDDMLRPVSSATEWS